MKLVRVNGVIAVPVANEQRKTVMPLGKVRVEVEVAAVDAEEVVFLRVLK